LADQQQLSVLLPLQRGRSLDGLPQLQGSDRLWPIVPARSLEMDRLAEALLADGVRRVMVVRDASAESQALSERFSASFANGRGALIGPTGEPISVDGRDRPALEQLQADVDWYRPSALVVLTAPASPLAQAIRGGQWPQGLLLAWPFRVSGALAQPQLGVDPLSRGPGWQGFAQRFERRWGYRPGLVESAGYDTGQVAALAAVQVAGRSGWDLQWFGGKGQPLPLCSALRQRRAGAAVRPLGATSRFDLGPASSPTAQLNISRAAASQP
jgi:ABC-type branched-subunit amino acid transport system substrate-binding protein